MIESIEWLRLFILNHQTFQYVIIFLGAALGGEFALFTFGFLAAQGALGVVPVIVVSFLGAFLPNILWFFIGKTKTMSNIYLHRYANTTTSSITEAVTAMSNGSHLVALILIKFIVGTPLILTMYVNKTNISFRRFMYYESYAIILSLLVILPFGFISGYGFTYLTSVFDSLYTAIGFLLLIVLVIFIIKSSIKKKLSRKM